MYHTSHSSSFGNVPTATRGRTTVHEHEARRVRRTVWDCYLQARAARHHPYQRQAREVFSEHNHTDPVAPQAQQQSQPQPQPQPQRAQELFSFTMPAARLAANPVPPPVLSSGPTLPPVLSSGPTLPPRTNPPNAPLDERITALEQQAQMQHGQIELQQEQLRQQQQGQIQGDQLVLLEEVREMVALLLLRLEHLSHRVEGTGGEDAENEDEQDGDAAKIEVNSVVEFS